MLRRSGFRAVILVVAVMLTATPAAMAGDHWPPASRGLGEVLATLWGTLASVFNAPAACESGSIMDPNGCPRAVATTTCDRGSIMDPNGCPQTLPDSGSIMDPDG